MENFWKSSILIMVGLYPTTFLKKFALSPFPGYSKNMSKIALIFSSGFGMGFIPWASGTFGTLWGVLIFFLSQGVDPWFFFVGTLIFILFSVLVSHLSEKTLGTHDSSIIVIDEVAGYLVTVLFLPFNWIVLALSFFLFRFFDILKPFPIRQIDRRMPGGWGVVLDDVMAGIYSNLLIRIILYFIIS